MFVTRLTQIDLAMRAGDIMTHTDFTRAQEWVKEFTPQGNIKCAISETKQDGLDLIAQQLARNCIPYWAGGDKAAQFLRFRVDRCACSTSYTIRYGRWGPSGTGRRSHRCGTCGT